MSSRSSNRDFFRVTYVLCDVWEYFWQNTSYSQLFKPETVETWKNKMLLSMSQASVIARIMASMNVGFANKLYVVNNNFLIRNIYVIYILFIVILIYVLFIWSAREWNLKRFDNFPGPYFIFIFHIFILFCKRPMFGIIENTLLLL